MVKKDSSLRLKSTGESVVDKVYSSLNEEGNKQVKIRMRQTRIPEIGDKFASLSAQKVLVVYFMKHLKCLLLPQEFVQT